VSGRLNQFPYLRGAGLGDEVDTGSAGAYNYCNTLLLHWVRNAFIGWRGSIRYKFIPRGKNRYSDRIEVERSDMNGAILAPTYALQYDPLPPVVTSSFGRWAIVHEYQAGTGDTMPFRAQPLFGAKGSALTTTQVNGALEVEIPYYSNYRFSPGRPTSYTGSAPLQSSWDYRIWFEEEDGPVTPTATKDLYVATGEDFQVYFWVGLPRMYYEPSPPDA
jgi:hypothetical protein